MLWSRLVGRGACLFFATLQQRGRPKGLLRPCALQAEKSKHCRSLTACIGEFFVSPSAGQTDARAVVVGGTPDARASHAAWQRCVSAAHCCPHLLLHGSVTEAHQSLTSTEGVSSCNTQKPAGNFCGRPGCDPGGSGLSWSGVDAWTVGCGVMSHPLCGERAPQPAGPASAWACAGVCTGSAPPLGPAPWLYCTPPEDDTAPSSQQLAIILLEEVSGHTKCDG